MSTPLSDIHHLWKYRIGSEIFVKIAQILANNASFNACLIEDEEVVLVWHSPTTEVTRVDHSITELIPLWSCASCPAISVMALPQGTYKHGNNIPMTGIGLHGNGAIMDEPLMFKSRPSSPPPEPTPAPVTPLVLRVDRQLWKKEEHIPFG